MVLGGIEFVVLTSSSSSSSSSSSRQLLVMCVRENEEAVRALFWR